MSSNLFNAGRIGLDSAVQSQRDVLNNKHQDYYTANFFTDPAAGRHIDFATSFPTMTTAGSHLGGSVVDESSKLSFSGVEQTRSLEKLQNQTRPFLTIPYLGRGSCDPKLESQLMQGDRSNEKKSVGTIMSKSFMDYRMNPADDQTLPETRLEDLAMDGWVRGGELTRKIAGDDHYSQKSRSSGLM